MSKLKLSNNNFLEWFIKEEKYLQNPPLETKKFIEFCKKRGIVTNEEELEFFEKEKLLFPIIRIECPIKKEERIFFKKDEREFWRPAKFGLQEGEIEIDRKKVAFYSLYRFNENSKDLLSSWIEKGNLFNPSTKSFQEWKTFKGKELQNNRQKIVSLYSSFQIYWLEILKKASSFNINFVGKNIKVSSPFSFVNNVNYSESFSIAKIKDFITKLEEILNKKVKTLFDFNQKKEELKKEYVKFNKFLKFMLSIQSVYYPIARSSSRKIQIIGDMKKWLKIRRDFDLKNLLDLLNLKIEDIAEWYKILSDKSKKLLGIVRDDWIQIWKNISWSKKNKIEGKVGLGVEYLQWAVMLKKVIEDYQKEEILDIDEIKNIDAKDILKYNPSQMDQRGTFLRATRNIRYTDPKENKNYYYDKYKRLYYLANDFKLYYQPKIAVFVEGYTEESILPIVFEWYYGDKTENFGIEFINFRGVDQLISTSENAEKLRQLIIELQREERKRILSKNKYKKLSRLIRDLNNVDIVISNWTSFLSYNLEKWQIIPFFIADDEGNIKHFLEAEKPIRFGCKDYNVPQNWRHLWGGDNKNKPFVGKDFEMANFSNQEITTVLTELLGKDITENQIQKLRDNGEGIKKIDNNIERMKIKIAEKLCSNLFNKYAKKGNNSVLERPIFKVIERIAKLAVLNHPPTCRKIELKKRKIIKEHLLGISIKQS